MGLALLARHELRLPSGGGGVPHVSLRYAVRLGESSL
jgi:hypothetical protein